MRWQTCRDEQVHKRVGILWREIKGAVSTGDDSIAVIINCIDLEGCAAREGRIRN
jgi:hypothetical protein